MGETARILQRIREVDAEIARLVEQMREVAYREGRRAGLEAARDVVCQLVEGFDLEARTCDQREPYLATTGFRSLNVPRQHAWAAEQCLCAVERLLEGSDE